jgi:hypothetical protein
LLPQNRGNWKCPYWEDGRRSSVIKESQIISLKHLEINKQYLPKINQERDHPSIYYKECGNKTPEETTNMFKVVAWSQTVGWARGMQVFIIFNM